MTAIAANGPLQFGCESPSCVLFVIAPARALYIELSLIGHTPAGRAGVVVVFFALPQIIVLPITPIVRFVWCCYEVTMPRNISNTTLIVRIRTMIFMVRELSIKKQKNKVIRVFIFSFPRCANQENSKLGNEVTFVCQKQKKLKQSIKNAFWERCFERLFLNPHKPLLEAFWSVLIQGLCRCCAETGG